MVIDALLPYFVPGVLYGIATLGLAIIFRYCRFPDLTVLASIAFGGVSCTYFTNLCGPFIGLSLGAAAGALLGSITSSLTNWLGIQPVLAGIITMTGSLSISYWLAPTGSIEMTKDYAILSATFSRKDVWLSSLIAAVVCVLLGVLMKSRWGCLILAMTGTDSYNSIRHRYYKQSFAAVAVLGNAIVGLAGGLLAHKSLGANVVDHQQFLPFGLGAIFGGNALTGFLSAWAKSQRDDEKHSRNQVKKFVFRIGELLSPTRDDSERTLMLSFSYLVGCVALVLISGLVQSNALSIIHPYLSIGGEWRYLVTAVLIAFGVFWAKKDGEFDV